MMLDHLNLLWTVCGALICLLVLLGCVCRIDAMHVKRNKFGVLASYLLFAVYAGGVMTDLFIDRSVDWYAAAGVAGIGLFLLTTHSEWKNGPPFYSRRKQGATS